MLSPNSVKWCHALIHRVITNEKYVGDLKTGKYYSDNVISHKRKVNYGEKEHFFTSNHHEAIISRELWNKCQEILESKELDIINQINELENKLVLNKDLELNRKLKLEQANNISKTLKEYPGELNLMKIYLDRIIIGEVLDNGKEDLYKIKFILKTGEMIKDNLPNNTLKIDSDIGHYGFKINKQSLEIK
ncbi:MAG: recombinase family protein [Bacilli bacterium]